ncbi:WD40-repeat-containing domain protein [Chytriomyces sp. MP71]|nr:WD40-repeat-containing domain protein [Chytriomyces sp. MP71]
MRERCHFVEHHPSGVHFAGVAFSPDSTCILASDSRRCLRLFDAPATLFAGTATSRLHSPDPKKPDSPFGAGPNISELAPESTMLAPSLAVKCPENVYSFAWFPFMRSADTATCLFAASIRDHPIQLFDAYSGEVRAAYTAKGDVVTAPHSIAFSPNGSRVYGGLEGRILAFDLNFQGSNPIAEISTTPTRKSPLGQKGILSCLSTSPYHPNLLLAGSFSKSVGIYDLSCNEPVAIVKAGLIGTGVTQVELLADGNRILVGSRKSRAIQILDIRYLDQQDEGIRNKSNCIVQEIERDGMTNQRLGFSASSDGSVLCFGDQGGSLSLYSLIDSRLVGKARVSNNAVGGTSISPYFQNPNYQRQQDEQDPDVSMDVEYGAMLPSKYWVSACTGERSKNRVAALSDSDVSDHGEVATGENQGGLGKGTSAEIKVFEFSC